MATMTPMTDAPVQLICMAPSLVITSIKKHDNQHLFHPTRRAGDVVSAENEPKSSSHLASWLIELLFFSSPDDDTESSSRFLSYVETQHEVSIVMDEAKLAKFPEGALTHEPTRWKALQVASAGAGAFLTQLATLHELTMRLAHQNISVFQISTYQTDYILVKVEDLHRAIQCLRSFCDIEMEQDAPMQLELSRAVSMNSVDPDDTSELKTQQPDQDEASVQQHTLSAPHLDLYLIQIDKTCVRRQLYSFVHLFFHERRNSSTQEEDETPRGQLFLSYSETGDDISIVTSDIDFVQQMQSLAYAGEHGIMVSPDAWKVVQIGDHDLGFAETGIVAAHTRVLLSAGTMVFYLSTFSTDFMLIKEDEWSDALETLRTHFCLVEGSFLPLQHT
ncbi:hypothetical protein Poli38472_013745 [Pythium oligandrum]|uniref:GATS-like protein 3 n=1 Tax=Pythium oligandrum TaxID=41045 RepID=A0A8K1CDI5_PYTOL|nr:hypothetical protein Poli38472_013745 [Pythium oligandrum]|eukprot:TMW61282.1 hypothetical protein Poli38472_013745 [Pythium oligandrum]